MFEFGGMSIGEGLFKSIIKNVKFGSTIVELGSGKVTQLLSNFYTMYSVECDMEWIKQDFNTIYIYAPLTDTTLPIGWYDPQSIFSKLPKQYTALLVDGPNELKGDRTKLLDNMELFDWTVDIFIDDVVVPSNILVFNTLIHRLNRGGYLFRDGNKSFGMIPKA